MSGEEWQIVWFTAWVSALSTLAILPPGLAVAWLLARRRVTAFCFSARGLALLVAFGVLRNVLDPSGWLGH